jgi:nicotinate-nucleotide pyrophosphorylase (carboxylating)
VTEKAGLDASVVGLIDAALGEDGAERDWTTRWTVEASAQARARIEAREPLVLAGTGLAVRVFQAVDPGVRVQVLHGDGARVGEGTEVIRMEGPTRGILTAERTALNFLGRLSGIATLTRRFVERIEGSGARIVDTRKTTPGWRSLEKAAVRAGGGTNHRMGLSDMVLIKENHIAAAGGIGPAVDRVREANREGIPVEVEVETPEELEELRHRGVNRILLDNMELDELRESVRIVRGWPVPHPELEASGRMTLDRVREVALTGVDLISVGALTHSAPTVDLSLLVER